jgi:hypothetical protein
MSRVDQWQISLAVGGRGLGVWDKKTGGNADSDETTYRPGGLSEAISLGGSNTVENLTFQRLLQHGRDLGTDEMAFLYNGRGKHKMIATLQPLDPNGGKFGKPIVYTGTLKAVTLPDIDSESSDAALISIEMTCDTTIKAA